jgi:hypothetical protein
VTARTGRGHRDQKTKEGGKKKTKKREKNGRKHKSEEREQLKALSMSALSHTVREGNG